jgi:hypothetical protein
MHNIQQIDVFVAFCESYLGCEPYFSLWLTLFHGRHSGKGESMPASGGIVFQLQWASNFFGLGLPKKATADWWRYWFYVKEVTPEGEVKMLPYSAEPSTPRFLRVKAMPEGQRALVG